MDIICALEWIKNNIFWYGGDSKNITLQGQGSGANIILYLMTNMEVCKNKLFHKYKRQTGYGLNIEQCCRFAPQFNPQISQITQITMIVG